MPVKPPSPHAMPHVTLYTDGSCLGNPGPGGWAVILSYGKHETEVVGNEPHTTNNRMELTAAIQGLSALHKPCHVTLYTDSRYVMDGLTKWLAGWEKNGWKTAAKKPVQNADLWRQLRAASSTHTVNIHWIKGHSGHTQNERVDALARTAAQQA